MFTNPDQELPRTPDPDQSLVRDMSRDIPILQLGRLCSSMLDVTNISQDQCHPRTCVPDPSPATDMFVYHQLR